MHFFAFLIIKKNEFIGIPLERMATAATGDLKTSAGTTSGRIDPCIDGGFPAALQHRFPHEAATCMHCRHRFLLPSVHGPGARRSAALARARRLFEERALECLRSASNADKKADEIEHLRGHSLDRVCWNCLGKATKRGSREVAATDEWNLASLRL